MGNRRVRANFIRNTPELRHARIFRFFGFLFKTIMGVGMFWGISLGLIAWHDYLITCEYFVAKKVNVTGNSILLREKILETAGICDEINILSVNIYEARKKLLANPWITEARVSRDLPESLHIVVSEQMPCSIIDLGRKYILNTEGIIFKELNPADPVKLPVVHGLDFADIPAKNKPGSHAFNAVMEVLKIGCAEDSPFPVRWVERIDVDREIGITLFAPGFETISVNRIKLGFDNYRVKFARIKYILSYLKKNKKSYIESIDVNNIKCVVVNPGKENTDSGVDERSAINSKEV